MNQRLLFFLILGIDAFVLFIQTSQLSISYREALFLQGHFSFFQSLIKLSLACLGTNDFALRFPMILLHLGSAVLLYEIAKGYVNDRNRIWLVLIFVLLPGIVSSALIVDSAGLLIFGLLLFVYLFSRVSFAVLSLYLFTLSLIEGGFVYLFIGLFFYGMVEKKYTLALSNILFVILSVMLYGFDVHGSPKGYFLDSIGIYSAIFTPIVFVYVFYVLYRRGLTKEIDVVWFLASTAMVISLVLSFRQKIDVQHFAPYLVLALPLAAQTFANSYRVRLPQFRKKYKAIFAAALLFLLINSGVVFFNKYLYWVLEKPTDHFAYKMHIAKELADALHERGIDCVQTKKSMGLRLEFYGISKCNEFVLEEVDVRENNGRDVTISYTNKPIKFYSVTKVNNLTIQ
jgi:hypothetical protein